MNIGVFGGTFDPPHLGHLIIAEHVRSELALDSVLFVPSAISPHKQGRIVAEAHHRLAMLKLAVEGNGDFAVSDIEAARGGVSYTVDTLEQLHRLRPEEWLTLMIGTDNVLEFHLWKDPEKILGLARVVAMTRPGFPLDSAPPGLRGKILFCSVPEIGIASREIRERIGRGASIRYLVPDAVDRYIRDHRLYLTGGKGA